MGSQPPRGQNENRLDHETEPAFSDLLADKDVPADPNISSLVEEYLTTVRVRRTISGQPAALPQPVMPRPQVADPEPAADAAPPAPREGTNRRREAEQELASLRRRANTLVQGKHYADALSLFQRLYMLGNNDDSALYWMGECEYHLGNLPRAKDLLEQFLAAREGNVDRSVIARLTVIRRNLMAQNRTKPAHPPQRRAPIFRRPDVD